MPITFLAKICKSSHAETTGNPGIWVCAYSGYIIATRDISGFTACKPDNSQVAVSLCYGQCVQFAQVCGLMSFSTTRHTSKTFVSGTVYKNKWNHLLIHWTLIYSGYIKVPVTPLIQSQRWHLFKSINMYCISNNYQEADTMKNLRQKYWFNE